MFERLRQSPALLVAALAIVAALAGTALAGTTLTAAKKKHLDAKQDKKQFNSLLKNATSAPKLTAGSAQPVAFALINPNGTVAAGKGITNNNIAHPVTGSYCITGLSFAIKGAVVTPQFTGAKDVTGYFSTVANGRCAAAGEVHIESAPDNSSNPVPTDAPVYVVVFG